jgi:hypothetical protein
MGSGSRRRSSNQGSRIGWIALILSSILLLFMIENLWLDARLRHRSHRIPSFIPEAQSGTWYLVLALGFLAFVILIVCLTLLFRDRSASLAQKAGVSALVALVAILGVQWSLVTNGQPGLQKLLKSNKPHKIVLTWQASTSPVVGYNVYRRDAPGANFHKLNNSLVNGLTFTDDSVENEMTYYYMTRAVDKSGAESTSSNEFTVSVP